ncbi:RNA polymerase primary sigma factor [Acetitomaculum ruminis DSM 5522]|uniref:RNA polymerase primary sigma factor n=1 Tax=Acetitomaculum ruminis DSM 5522 TaxID=1120918 RepID=A0A1I0XP58_9FIRM|nr:sigma-70 domain-containing protein [Acetitomaculum ruminis]SFB02246.1 RNA polymerase primary sigma factor [Acetitomaculum ruminis DSM 5522]
MLDPGKFMELLNDLKNIAATNDYTLTTDEIRQFFSSMELNEENFEYIFQYLSKEHITIKGYAFSGKEEIQSPKENTIGAQDEAYINMYLKDLEEIPDLNDGEMQALCYQVKNNENDAISKFIEVMSKRVYPIAINYINQGVFLEDLISEANLGIIYAVKNIADIEDPKDYIEYIDEAIKMAIVKTIDAENELNGAENSILVKSNLLNEAARLLEKENGHAPSVKELAEYTKMDENEINDILNLHKKQN